PLLFVKNVRNVGYGELVRIRTPTGEERRGQVLEARSDIAVVQVFEGTSGLDVSTTSVRFLGETVKLPVSSDLLGRILDGSGRLFMADQELYQMNTGTFKELQSTPTRAHTRVNSFKLESQPSME